MNIHTHGKVQKRRKLNNVAEIEVGFRGFFEIFSEKTSAFSSEIILNNCFVRH